MNRITLEIEGYGQVIARFDGEHAAYMRELFGTNRIPTPYNLKGIYPVVLLQTHGARILADIREKNPGIPVNWSEDAELALDLDWPHVPA